MLTEVFPPGRRAVLELFGDDQLLTAREVASARRCSVPTVWRDVRAGRLPRPVYLAPHRPRWRLKDVVPQIEK